MYHSELVHYKEKSRDCPGSYTQALRGRREGHMGEQLTKRPADSAPESKSRSAKLSLPSLEPLLAKPPLSTRRRASPEVTKHSVSSMGTYPGKKPRDTICTRCAPHDCNLMVHPDPACSSLVSFPTLTEEVDQFSSHPGMAPIPCNHAGLQNVAACPQDCTCHNFLPRFVWSILLHTFVRNMPCHSLSKTFPATVCPNHLLGRR
jgi:hypothetical protein